MEQGTGKTWVTLGVLSQLMREDFCGLVIVPLTNLSTTWEKSIREELPGLTVARTLPDFKKAKGPRLLLLHYEGVNKVIKKLARVDWSLVVYDESQRLKQKGSKQSRDAAKLRHAERRLILSGTPIEQCPQDVWAQLRFAAPDVFGTRYADFKSAYLKPTGYMGYKTTFRQSKMPKFLAKIQDVSLRVRKDEVLDLPEMRIVRSHVPLGGSQAQHYTNMFRRMFTRVKGHAIQADMAITQLVKLQQIASGFIKDSENNTHRLGRAKLRRVKLIVKRSPLPVVVFAKYREELLMLREALREYRLGEISGKNRKTRTATIEAFQRGELDVLLCQIRSGGVGVDLFNARTVVFYSCTFSFIDYEQAISRVHRHGLENPFTTFLVLAKGTVDVEIFDAILSKRDVSESIVQQLRRPVMSETKVKNVKVKKAPPTEKKVKTEKVKTEKVKTEKTPAMKYSIKDLAEEMGIQPSSARVRLRAMGIERAGKAYGWNTKAELQEVIARMGQGKE